jgi:hypothetical protein
MKRTCVFIFIAVAAIVGLLWWHGHKVAESEERTSATNPPSTLPAFLGKTNPESLKNVMPSELSSGMKTANTITVEEYVKRSVADPQYDWKQPINFYGRVVDESNVPVADANAHFNWTDISEKGTSSADTKSDSNGFFSLTDRRGKRMSVTASKDGYYTYPSEKLSSFEYANPADGLFTPDPNRPVVFHLRKKSMGVDLITSQYGVKPYFGIPAPLDGTPVQADLLERKTGQGQLTISQVKPDYKHWKRATNWLFRMEIPNGGFIEQNDEFPYTAPEEGYQPVLEFNFQQDQPDWKINLEKNCYIKFGNPPRYGWLHLETSIDMAGARLTYAINPDGSRNLEPK